MGLEIGCSHCQIGAGKNSQHTDIQAKKRKWDYRVKAPNQVDAQSKATKGKEDSTQAKKRKWVYRAKNSNHDKSQPKSDKGKGVLDVESQSKQFDGNSDFQSFRGAGKANIHHCFRSIHIHSNGNGWLMRSAVAKIRKLLSPSDLL